MRLLIYAAIAWMRVIAEITYTFNNLENERTEMLVDLITKNIKQNGWNNIIILGEFPDSLYAKITELNATFTVYDVEEEEYFINEIVPYHPNIILIHTKNLDEFENALLKVSKSPYWHPLANIIFYHPEGNDETIAKLFYIFWYYKACNVVIVQYDDLRSSLRISEFSPYTHEKFMLQKNFGCWKTTKINWPIARFSESFACEEGCHNVSLYSIKRANHLGTCVGFNTHLVHYETKSSLGQLELFEEKSNDLHGFTFRAVAIEHLPVLKIKENSDGTYTLELRDGLIWTTLSKLLNFSIDLSSSKDVIRGHFDVEVVFSLFFKFAYREADLMLFPVYQFDVVIVEVDYSVPYRDSGLCIVSHKAGFETFLLDVKLLLENDMLIIKFLFCFLFVWLLFVVFSAVEKKSFSFDQAGKDFVNTIRNVMSISLYKPPYRGSFRIYLFCSLWCFFIINFSTQAAIISFFTAFKRGKDVETFEDILDKGYPIQSLGSPDSLLPESEEKYKKINSKYVIIKDYVKCLDNMTIDSRRFCLIDCSIARLLSRNRLNQKGEQYLHIARERIHSYHLNFLFHKHSPLTDRFNMYLLKFLEGGLINKWEQFHYADIKQEAQVKPLGMGDLSGVFTCYGLLLALSLAVFVVEVALYALTRLKSHLIKFVQL